MRSTVHTSNALSKCLEFLSTFSAHIRKVCTRLRRVAYFRHGFFLQKKLNALTLHAHIHTYTRTLSCAMHIHVGGYISHIIYNISYNIIVYNVAE